jgi:hypothetical protein
LTALLVHVFIACCLFALFIIKLIPVPVLYGKLITLQCPSCDRQVPNLTLLVSLSGVFLFMGLAGLSTNQFWHRFLLYFMQPSKYPTSVFMDNVKVKRIHLYTFIQVLSFGMLYAVKSIEVIAIAFPIIIFANIPIRSFILPRIFSKDELVCLDGEDVEIEKYLADKATSIKNVSDGSGDEVSVDDSRKMEEMEVVDIEAHA